MTTNFFRPYLDKLALKEEFIPLLQQFIDISVEDLRASEAPADHDEITYGMFYRDFMNSVFLNNVENVFNYCESPIERILLNSLMLLFVKNKMPCLFITPPFRNTELEVDNFRDHYKGVDKLIESYKIATNDHELKLLDERLQEKCLRGEFLKEEVEDILMYRNIRKVFEFDSYHITPQAFFPNLTIDNKAVRADYFVWVPNDPRVKIIIECDGFAFHHTKASFINDRKRDRLFQLKGYRVIRYSGSEIYNDPIQVSSDLFDLLEAFDEDNEEKRIM